MHNEFECLRIYEEYQNGKSIEKLSKEYGRKPDTIESMIWHTERRKKRGDTTTTSFVGKDLNDMIVRVNMKELTFEEFKKILDRKGATTVQKNSLVVAMIWEYLSDLGEQEIKFKKNIENEIASLNVSVNTAKKKLQVLEKMYESKVRYLNILSDRLNSLIEKGITEDNICRVENIIQQEDMLKTREYELNQKYEKLMEFETPEVRDRNRLAEIYSKNVCIQTKYDNTAYIAGLAAILSGTDSPLTKLNEINPKINGD